MSPGKTTRTAEVTARSRTRAKFVAVAVAIATSPVLAGPVPDYDFDWAAIGDVGNPGMNGPDIVYYMRGRGSVGYRYRIAKEEITTAQWLDFVNTYATQSSDLAWFGLPDFWGARLDPDYAGPGNRWVLRTDVPDAGRLPVFGMTWREAAQYCNWLHNGKSSSLDAIANGAYDTSTFTENPDGTFNDQATHNADAKFWIPTLDEWVKAAHYEPRHADGTGGLWWRYPDGGDEPLTPGLPQDGGQTTVGMEVFGDILVYDIPLGIYDVVSPWGLIDVSGGASEWTEEILDGTFWAQFRAYDGGSAGEEVGWLDRLDDWNISSPWHGPFTSLRIAGIVPAPGPFVAGLVLACHSPRRRAGWHL